MVKNFVITYIDEAGEEQICEIPAFSQEQAVFIFACEYTGQIFGIENTGRVMASI